MGLVAAGITSAIVLLVGLFFFCRYRRRRELAKGEVEAGRKSGAFGRGAKRSVSQNSAESKRKLLARTTTREKNDGGSEDVSSPGSYKS